MVHNQAQVLNRASECTEILTEYFDFSEYAWNDHKAQLCVCTFSQPVTEVSLI